MLQKIIRKKIVLGSKSPRRQQLLKELGLDFEIRTRDTDESFDSNLKPEDIAMNLARIKAEAIADTLSPDELLITSDTIVCLNNEVLNKPANSEEAHAMLRKLSGKMHRVYTGVCLQSTEKQQVFVDETRVFFRELNDAEITYYVKQYQPFDKAGAYGAQEWIGYIGVERIEGSYFNVMGLPLHKLYLQLKRF